jgi:hypothetical protein
MENVPLFYNQMMSALGITVWNEECKTLSPEQCQQLLNVQSESYLRIEIMLAYSNAKRIKV